MSGLLTQAKTQVKAQTKDLSVGSLRLKRKNPRLKIKDPYSVQCWLGFNFGSRAYLSIIHRSNLVSDLSVESLG